MLPMLSSIQLPMIKWPIFYGGQMGVPGSDSPLGERVSGEAVVIYVDENHPMASDNNDGTNPLEPKATVASAVASTLLCEGSIIKIAAQATIVETVTVTSSAPKNVTIMGETNGTFHPTWQAATAAGVCLTLQQQNWRIHGIEFIGQVNDTSACINLMWNGTDTINASYTMIDQCIFNGAYGGKYGITYEGAPYNVTIVSCQFLEFIHGDSTGAAIYGKSANTADALEWLVINCIFQENDNHVMSAANDYGFNGSIFAYNVFTRGSMVATALKLDLRGGSLGRNTVFANLFGGADYSNVGGYYDGAAGAGNWVGNFTEDTLEAEVGDNGLTILPPT